MVSGSLSLPSRGPFHLSLTVLCAIGSRRVFCLGGWSPQLPPGFLVSRRTQVRRQASARGFAYGALTLSGRPSQAVPLASRSCRSPRRRPTTPSGSLPMVWAPPLSLAATKGISFDFSSCGYLDGSLPRVYPLQPMCSARRCRPFMPAGYPIRTPVDRRSLAPPHGFSQLSASFLAWRLPGILHEPVFT